MDREDAAHDERVVPSVAHSLNSLNSFGYRGEKDVMYGPYVGPVEQAVCNQAAAS